jgi:hypothetical protein
MGICLAFLTVVTSKQTDNVNGTGLQKDVTAPNRVEFASVRTWL